MPAKDGPRLTKLEILERENTTLKIQLLQVTRDLANVVSILTDGHRGLDGWGKDGQ